MVVSVVAAVVVSGSKNATETFDLELFLQGVLDLSVVSALYTVCMDTFEMTVLNSFGYGVW